MKRTLTFVGLVVLACFGRAYGQSLQAVTSPAGPGLKVVVSWTPATGVSRFNLYRTPGPAPPLNSTPIARLTTCAQIQSVLGIGSDAWNQLSSGLAAGKTLFDPCAISTIVPGSAAEKRLQFLAGSNWRIAVVAGQGYVDSTVTAGTKYSYELRGVDALGNETGAVFAPATVVAGSPAAIPPPGGLAATAGDSRVLLLWGDQKEAAGFLVYRANNAAGPYQQVNASPLVTQVNSGVDGSPLATPSNGFLDIQRWSVAGLPDTHVVNGVTISGPSDGITYYYRVVSIDILGQPGPMSGVVSATPADTTAPAAPSGVTVTALDPQSRIEIRWGVVTLDVEGHADPSGVSGYNVYRFDAENAPFTSGVQIGSTLPQPAAGTVVGTTIDSSGNLRPAYGEKTFWYRVRAVDAGGNLSAYSAAVGGHLKDITPPAPPKNVAADGFDDYIEVRWAPSAEPDLDHYQVYRSYCHNGKANPCDPARERPAGVNNKENNPMPCTGEYELVGTVSLAQAKAMGNPVSFRDTTLPPNSPVCYSYWIKAYDQAQNMSGSWPVPGPDEQTVCQRLRDKTPPDPAIISGLFARDGAIRVEWIGAPVQDIRAYQVYRADKDTGPYQFVGGMTVEPPPATPQVLTSPYSPPPQVNCATIPLVTIDSMSMGFFIDRHVQAKKIYWYKVLGIDQNGNLSPMDKAVPISTFTSTTAQPPAPVIASVTASTTTPFELVVSWTPVFNPAASRGFAVFRSDSQSGLYRQVGTLLTASEYHDRLVVKNATYWYKVLRMDLTGQVSRPSTAVSGSLGP
jgi:hypothetical protein